ncbi:MAG: NAD/FAD-binding protein, partial [Rhodospirillaceae bacterium]|nr:NAD/FAD-binding protein [Rhodospirillaceae bacterium]
RASGPWSRILLRFYREAPRDLSFGRLEGATLGEYVTAAGYSEAFVEDHLLPMAAAIWSSPLAAMRDHSAASIVRFFNNHGLLQMKNRSVWRTVAGGSREYVRRLTERYLERVKLRCGAVPFCAAERASGSRMRPAPSGISTTS